MIRVGEPATMAVTLAEAKQHLRVDHADDDEIIGLYLDAAISHLDGWNGILGIALEAQTWEMALDAFPAREIRIPLGPFVSVVSIKYIDTAGILQTVATSEYDVDTYQFDGWIVPVTAWPQGMDAVNSVLIRWVAGKGCPAAIKQAILLMVGHWYENREAVGAPMAKMPLAVDALTSPWRRVTF